VRAGGAAGDRDGGGAALLERLMREVRPEFRGDVFVPPRGNPVFFYGECRLPPCTTAISRPRTGLCESHHQWWLVDARPPLAGWVAGAEERVWDRRRDVARCSVAGCNRSPRRWRLCVRHEGQWERAGKPPRDQWAASAAYIPLAAGERDCRYPHCPRWSDGPNNPFCGLHWRRWCWAGRPELEDWLAGLAQRYNPTVDLRGLDRAVRLEVQFGLQCRSDERAKITNAATLTKAVHHIRAAGVASLLNWDDEQWRAFTGRDRPGGQAERSFILDTCFNLRGLLITDPWADQYPRDVWDLKVLGLNREVRYLRFDRIPQRWLRELVKRWCRWRLSRGLAPSTVNHDALACRQLAEHFARVSPDNGDPAALTREVLESWFAALRTTYADPTTRRHRIHSVAGLLRDAHNHGWEPALPRGAFVFDDDTPRSGPSKPRWIPEYVMRQIEAPDSLARFPTEQGRLLVKILISCGLRLGDARRLPLDCLVRDDQNSPYLAWINYKIQERGAFFPVSEELAGEIAEQQRQVRERFPAGRWLFTAHQANLDGGKPMDGHTMRAQLKQWLVDISLVDEAGAPVRVTPHQFRHTLATRLINADVPQHVVQELLDHMSPEMTSRYARLHQATLRRQWVSTLKVNADGDPATIAPGHPLADAQWMRISMVRAKVSLPNGYCGAPVQTECEHTNPCLDCRFFVTTRDFLGQHRRQREETQRMAADAERAGLARLVERNQRTAAKLDRLIAVLDQASDEQVVVGGRAEDLDAAG